MPFITNAFIVQYERHESFCLKVGNFCRRKGVIGELFRLSLQNMLIFVISCVHKFDNLYKTELFRSKTKKNHVLNQFAFIVKKYKSNDCISL